MSDAGGFVNPQDNTSYYHHHHHQQTNERQRRERAQRGSRCSGIDGRKKT
jgi:hypothetical protein